LSLDNDTIKQLALILLLFNFKTISSLMLANSIQNTEIHIQVKYLSCMTSFESSVKTDVIIEDTLDSGQTGALN